MTEIENPDEVARETLDGIRDYVHENTDPPGDDTVTEGEIIQHMIETYGTHPATVQVGLVTLHAGNVLRRIGRAEWLIDPAIVAEDRDDETERYHADFTESYKKHLEENKRAFKKGLIEGFEESAERWNDG